MNAPLESQHQKPQCLVCKLRTIPTYFIGRGPLCMKHWSDASKAYFHKDGELSRVHLGNCIKCQRWTPVIMFKEEGPYCVEHYLLLFGQQKDLDLRDENKETDQS